MLLHVLQLGLAWRAYRLLLRYSQKSWINLATLRMIHVALCGFPVIVTQARLLFVEEIVSEDSNESVHGANNDVILHRSVISPLPVLSVVVSLVSCAIAMCAFVLRHKLHHVLDQEEKSHDSEAANTFSKIRHAGIGVLVTGTFMCLTARLGSFSLLSAQHGIWVLLPFAFHFFFHLLIHLQSTCHIR